ncbi:MAG TPA: hypothetical protein VGR57_01690, partial [Ktedonobacterales bacterium]|nr:hypothetical protein [Ktedonobacterales bacterium]
SGLFWTVPVSNDDVQVDLDAATASMRLNDFDLEDYHTLKNAILDGPSVPASVSFTFQWSGVLQRVEESSTTEMYRGHFIHDRATVAWTAQEQGFRFVSDPAETSTTTFAEIGRERSGVFFAQPGEIEDEG